MLRTTLQLTQASRKRQKKTLPRIYMPILNHAYIEGEPGPQRRKMSRFMAPLVLLLSAPRLISRVDPGVSTVPRLWYCSWP
jgi:hypothetical protein